MSRPSSAAPSRTQSSTDPLDASILEATKSLLAKVVTRAVFVSDKLLQRPPFHFLYDLIGNIGQQSGRRCEQRLQQCLLSNCSSASMGDGTCQLLSLYAERGGPPTKLQKLEFLAGCIQFVEEVTHTTVYLRPAAVVTGTEVNNTLLFLQQFIRAAQSFHSSNTSGSQCDVPLRDRVSPATFTAHRCRSPQPPPLLDMPRYVGLHACCCDLLEFWTTVASIIQQPATGGSAQHSSSTLPQLVHRLLQSCPIRSATVRSLLLPLPASRLAQSLPLYRSHCRYSLAYTDPLAVLPQPLHANGCVCATHTLMRVQAMQRACSAALRSTTVKNAQDLWLSYGNFLWLLHEPPLCLPRHRRRLAAAWWQVRKHVGKLSLQYQRAPPTLTWTEGPVTLLPADVLHQLQVDVVESLVGDIVRADQQQQQAVDVDPRQVLDSILSSLQFAPVVQLRGTALLEHSLAS